MSRLHGHYTSERGQTTRRKMAGLPALLASRLPARPARRSGKAAKGLRSIWFSEQRAPE